jgi:hypothetical protein
MKHTEQLKYSFPHWMITLYQNERAREKKKEKKEHHIFTEEEEEKKQIYISTEGQTLLP